MKSKIVLTLFVFGMTVLSCAEKEKWPEQTRVEFVTSCEASFLESFKSGVGDLIDQIDNDKLQAMAASNCSCQYEAMQNNYDSAEEAFKHSLEEQLEIGAHCEPTDEAINDLLE